MKVRFYLKEREVKKVLFKQFSSHCTIWLHLLSLHEHELNNSGSTLNLKYYPATNMVVPEYDNDDPLIRKMHETALRMSRSCYSYEQPRQKPSNNSVRM